MKRVDTLDSLRLSAEYVGRDSIGSQPASPSKGDSRKRTTSEAAKAGQAVVDEVVVPILNNVWLSLSHPHSVRDVNGVILQAIRDDMDAQEIEALSMLSRGFTELKEANAELAYDIVLDVLSGINECVVICVRCHIAPSDLSQAMLQCDSMFRRRVDYSHTSGLYARAR
jgi:serine/threonine-protein kinase 24/25/MST4